MPVACAIKNITLSNCSLLSSNRNNIILHGVFFSLYLSFHCISLSREWERVHGEVHVSVSPSNRALQPLRLEAECGCFEMNRSISTNVSARRTVPWKLRKNWVSYMQSYYMHICVHLCLFHFLPRQWNDYFHWNIKPVCYLMSSIW